jgi:hypothetical protein
VIGKQTVNTTLAKGHHAQTQHTAKNFLIFSHGSSTPIHYTLLFFLTGEDNYSQDRFPAIQKETRIQRMFTQKRVWSVALLSNMKNVLFYLGQFGPDICTERSELSSPSTPGGGALLPIDKQEARPIAIYTGKSGYLECSHLHEQPAPVLALPNSRPALCTSVHRLVILQRHSWGA